MQHRKLQMHLRATITEKTGMTIICSITLPDHERAEVAWFTTYMYKAKIQVGGPCGPTCDDSPASLMGLQEKLIFHECCKLENGFIAR